MFGKDISFEKACELFPGHRVHVFHHHNAGSDFTREESVKQVLPPPDIAFSPCFLIEDTEGIATCIWSETQITLLD